MLHLFFWPTILYTKSNTILYLLYVLFIFKTVKHIFYISHNVFFSFNEVGHKITPSTSACSNFKPIVADESKNLPTYTHGYRS